MLIEESPRLTLPERPSSLAAAPVAGWREPVLIETYAPLPPDRYPAYLDQRVYQGSSGRVYPLPFFERIDPVRRPVSWDAIHLENEWIRLMILPELGGRIHVGYDKIAEHDFFYRNDVIKPALIGLTGPWIAGGVEFNWPQHHRPATYLPTDATIEQDPDGSVTVWCSDHDPFTRMKGMHGICLRPDRAAIELKVRLYNSSEEPQTFLWWANVAVRAHDQLQAFFPPDVSMVADHARRAVTAFPAADRPYYGIDYPHRASTGSADGGVPGDRIDWYRNIPVPTSYMCLGSEGDFFGAYDHEAGAGFVHVADHRTAVGKKLWTWGNAPFGEAWCRNLTDDSSAYIELMAGVFTDNQPDFSFLAPGETKVFSQFWYPYQGIGPVQAATLDAAISVTDRAVGIAATARHDDATVIIESAAGRAEHPVVLTPGRPVRLPLAGDQDHDLVITVVAGGVELARWARTEPAEPGGPATEPPAPEAVGSVEELYLTGVHLEQYRHATRSPEPYWAEALRRDPDHAPTCTALAARRYRAGHYREADELLRRAVARLSVRNANPADTTAHYYLGLTRDRLGDHDGAYAAYAKAAWNRAWRAPAGYRAAVLDAAAGRNETAVERLTDVLRAEPEHLQARALSVIILRRLGRTDEAERLLAETRRLDPLHWWTNDLAGEPLTDDAQTLLDVALEYVRVGEPEAALRVLERAAIADGSRPLGAPAAGPLIAYRRAELLTELGRAEEAAAALAEARTGSDRWCFPARLDDADLLSRRVSEEPGDHCAAALLGHWLYDRDRVGEAVEAWQRAVRLDPSDPVCWRNLGLAAYNRQRDLASALQSYERAVQAAPEDARLRFEHDQLQARAGIAPAERWARLQDRPDLVRQRDDAVVELAQLRLSLGDHEAATDLLLEREFQPWEGGEGQTLRAWDRACLAQADAALAAGRPRDAVGWLDRTLDPPRSLGEQRHPLANSAWLRLARGDALAAAGDHDAARMEWAEAAAQSGDFLTMSTTPFSEATAASITALRRLGRSGPADELAAGLSIFCDELEATPATVDYFATSLPTLLLFADDPELIKNRRVRFLRAQLAAVNGCRQAALSRLDEILAEDPNHADAIDLKRRLQTQDQSPSLTGEVR
ncbi:tetratricopeptide repeat protein [Microlunatus parietis]|uniref:Tetratricopeptide (TPR) repeat protein n=1 Tax=Microlunatus parietis TaxID=682979 RepID=A0A7Y9LEJ3_9ACTN|nr:DUF5107 domain-containing protein [Microlunatus parietis]NYE75032.1 tetratricopeptide (TPR) repeat protein [Microlunatus parietis]